MEVQLTVDDQAQLTRSLWMELVYLRAGWRCEKCGATPWGDCRGTRPRGRIGPRLHAHHLNGDDSDNRLANGKCLCVPCHARLTMTGRKRCMSDDWREKMEESVWGRRRGKRRELSESHRKAILANVASPTFATTAARGRHVRWHVNRGIVQDDCEFCREES